MSRISIEVGHGGADSGATTADKKVFEKDINLVVALELKRQLERHGQTVLISRTVDCNDKAADFFPKSKAFNPDLHVSVHTNAFDGTAKGFEIYRNTNEYKSKSDLLCTAIETEVKMLGQISRGIKNSGFLMSGLPCATAYCELGFMDNPADYTKFDTVKKQQAFGTTYAKGVLTFLKIAWKPENITDSTTTPNNTTIIPKTLYRVVAGSYSTREGAEAWARELKGRGFDSFIDIVK